MNTHNTNRYSALAMFLHWLLALGLVGMFAVGLYMADLPFSPQRLKLYNWHKWAGVTILALSALRLGWRLVHRPPALPQSIELATQGGHLDVHFLTEPLQILSEPPQLGGISNGLRHGSALRDHAGGQLL